MISKPTIFTRWGDMQDEEIFEDFLSMIYKEDNEEPKNPKSNFDPTNRGYQLVK